MDTNFIDQMPLGSSELPKTAKAVQRREKTMPEITAFYGETLLVRIGSLPTTVRHIIHILKECISPSLPFLDGGDSIVTVNHSIIKLPPTLRAVRVR